LQLSRTFGIGVGVGYLRLSKDSLITLAGAGVNPDITLSGTPTLSALPICVGMFLTFPIVGNVNLTADGGAAYYAELKFDMTQRVESGGGNWHAISYSASRSDVSANLGFQGSLGLEFKISRKMGFFIEALGRYARFKTFDVATIRSEWSDGDSETEEGKLYIRTDSYPQGT
jgi:opacity protein-like surface antigen